MKCLRISGRCELVTCVGLYKRWCLYLYISLLHFAKVISAVKHRNVFNDRVYVCLWTRVALKCRQTHLNVCARSFWMGVACKCHFCLCFECLLRGFKIHALTGFIRVAPIYHHTTVGTESSITAPNYWWPKFLRRPIVALDGRFWKKLFYPRSITSALDK